MRSSEKALLLVLTCAQTRAADEKFVRLADMLGIESLVMDAAEAESATDFSNRIDQSSLTCLAASSDSLSVLARQTSMELPKFVFAFPKALLHGFDGSESSDAILKSLTAGGTSGGIEITEPHQSVSLSNDLPPPCRPLSGLRFMTGTNGGNWRAFEKTNAESLVTLGGAPCFVRVRQGASQLFLLGGSRLLDIDGPASPDLPTPETYLELIPWLIFLRSAFQEYCWHNPHPRAAWVIDDPLLRARYGFLCYEDLLRAADEHDFTATIAFIPWNWDRNSADTLSVFRSRPDRLSICVHGCDHTEGEFRRLSETELRAKAALALARMRELERRAQVGFDLVMVFPQGGFSKAALRALGAEGFLAALNTSVFPADWKAGDLSFRDYFDVAVTRYGRCPLFSRKYPVSVLPLAFDLFMGKPALLVEHHTFFKTGYEPAMNFVGALSAQEPGLTWSSPAEIFREAALYRCAAAHQQFVRFYTDLFLLRNTTSDSVTYRLQRPWPFEERISHALLDGNPVDAGIAGAMLSVEVTLPPGDLVEIEIPRSPQPPARVQFSRRYRTGVAARRYLSEFRDNYISCNEWLLPVAQNLRNRLQGRPRVATSTIESDAELATVRGR